MHDINIDSKISSVQSFSFHTELFALGQFTEIQKYTEIQFALGRKGKYILDDVILK